MAKNVVINGNAYILPQQSDNEPWGSNLSELVEALVDVANNSISTGDILTTSFQVGNGVSNAPVTGLLFDPAVVRSAVIEMSVARSTVTNEYSEMSMILVTYKSSTSTWQLAHYGVGDAECTFDITPAGQILVTSSTMSGSGYSGLMVFKARAYNQT